MATYKLIQDIEAEDHILGPLTLRQFIFGLVAAFCYYLDFVIFVKQAYFLLIIFLPPALFCTFFAIPFGRDQPTEIWALAKLRFWFMPRRRVWNQSGVKELVTITVPKKIEPVLTKGFSQTEVKSRLKALANTIDTRGWAIKNINTYASASTLTGTNSDRLIDFDQAPPEVPSYDLQPADDILDEVSNPVAQQFDTMITQSAQSHRQQLMDELNGVRSRQAAQPPANQADYWFMNKSGITGQQAPVTAQVQVVGDLPAAPAETQPAVDEAALAAQLKAKSSSGQAAYSRMRTLKPQDQSNPTTSSQAAPTPGATPSDPAILSLANRDDLNVSTLAREAYKAKTGDEPSQDEVVIPLH